MSEKIVLAEIPQQVIEVVQGDTTYQVDPYVVARKLEPLAKQVGGDDFGVIGMLDGVKAALGIPNLTDHQAVYLAKKILELVDKETAAKEPEPTQPS